MKIFSLFIVGLSLMNFTLLNSSCSQPKQTTANEDGEAQMDEGDLSEFSIAYFASGCFWCVEAIFESVKGVPEVISGYAGGHTKNPTYESSNTGRTGHAEAVKVFYDPDIISFESLVTVYFDSHDPTTVNGQAPDFGSQYRSIVFYQNAEEQRIIGDYIKRLEDSNSYQKPIATEVKMFELFYEAEAYHQNYERLNPNQPYIRAISIPRLNRFKAKHPELLKRTDD